MSQPEKNKPLILSSWRVYSGEAAELPAPFLSVLVYKGGEDGAFIGVFSAYRPDTEAVWMPLNAVTGPLPIEPGDRWMNFPDPPEDEA